MSAAELSEAIQNTGFFTAMRESMLVYPIVLSCHLASIAIFGGMILMTDLRLLGVAMKSMSITDVVRQTRIWKGIGLVVSVTCGILLAGSKFASYYDNPYFQIKMTLLALVGVHAILFRKSVYHNTEELDRLPKIPRVAKVAACTSMILWVGILSAGRWIAYFERPTPTASINAAQIISASAR
jgi:hypothetical protein